MGRQHAVAMAHLQAHDTANGLSSSMPPGPAHALTSMLLAVLAMMSFNFALSTDETT